MKRNPLLFFLALITIAASTLQAEPLNISGVYPSLRMWNNENECGTGATVIWQGDLWAITYAPHAPRGSSDKLYQITPDLEQKIYAESVGGTPANRMIHRESNQLLIGPYLIDADKNIRTITPKMMLGRLTANARHLTDPANKVYYATMEEGLYAVDVNTLAVTTHILDGHAKGVDGIASKLPGYHGKGMYSGQGRVVYSNNGDTGPGVKTDPTTTSGALAQWFGKPEDWQLVRRNQFTEVTGPGGIHGNANPDKDPIWAMGWDARSLVLALLEDQTWHYYRLPKGSHSYDGAHGWNTEWPRIREIGEKDFLATMHGTFWRFPPTFSRNNSAGIAPRSNYLKVIGDFCRWNDRIVLGCDDSAKAEFLNTRSFKAKHAAPVQSNSNFWFVKPEQLDELGPIIGRGSVWLRDEVTAGTPSNPYLFAGYDHRQLHLTANDALTVNVEVDREGNNTWTSVTTFSIPAGGSVSHTFPASAEGAWVRLTPAQNASGVTAHFQYRDRDDRSSDNDALFDGITRTDTRKATSGIMRSLSYNKLGLVTEVHGQQHYYEMNEALELTQVDDRAAANKLVKAVRQPDNAFRVDAASVIIEEDGSRYRIPRDARYLATTDAASSKPGKTLADHLPQSLARHAAVKVSSTHGAYAAKFANDGILDDDAARWISTEDDQGAISLDFGEAKTYQSIWVVSGWQQSAQYVARNFDVQIKVGGKWQTLPNGSVRNNGSIEREILLPEPVGARELRIASTDTGFLRIYEVAVFAERPEIDNQAPMNLGGPRVCREVATERDLLNIHGTFYELPARNAQGLAKMRPIATHGLAVNDFCSHNGLLFFTGIAPAAKGKHIFRSDDRHAAVWAGVIDDLWKLGKPRGVGGPWKNTAVKSGVPSDPYLMTGYDQKKVTLSADAATEIQLEVDVDGTGLWIPYQAFVLEAGQSTEHAFPEGYSAYWVRATSERDATVSVTFTYE